jgi:tRNA modification GTPase
MNNNGSTIAAISTALSESGIGIIRVSGDEAVSIVNKIFVKPSGRHFLCDVPTHTIHYGFVVSLENGINEEIDECLVSVMKGPKSFTGEDVVEINCHGGIFVVKKVLSEVLKAGAKLAEPGDFSKRAFLNGRIDLAEAEAVMDVISSKNDSSLKASLNQLSGSVSSKIRKLREEVLYNIAFIESALDDPEHISLDGFSDKLYGLLNDWIKEIDKLIRSNDSGRFLREGINTVLLGKPNAGKSSVMNLLLGEDRAIVTDIAGTTRDTLEEYIKLGEIGLNLVDTAGIREADNTVEQIGVDRAKKAAGNADLILFVIDISENISDDDFNQYEFLMKTYSDKKGIVLLNKIDTLESKEELSSVKRIIEMVEEFGYKYLYFSAVSGEGFEGLKNTIEDLFYKGINKNSDEVVITNIRHRNCLEECKNSLLNVVQSLDNGMEEDFLSIDLMDAYSSLGKIIGEEIEDDLATEIFSKFCLGK